MREDNFDRNADYAAGEMCPQPRQSTAPWPQLSWVGTGTIFFWCSSHLHSLHHCSSHPWSHHHFSQTLFSSHLRSSHPGSRHHCSSHLRSSPHAPLHPSSTHPRPPGNPVRARSAPRSHPRWRQFLQGVIPSAPPRQRTHTNGRPPADRPHRQYPAKNAGVIL